MEHHTCKSESVLNGEAPLDPNDPILHMEEKIDPQDPVRAVKDGVKKAAENLHASAEAKAAQFQDAAENAWSDAQSRAKTCAESWIANCTNRKSAFAGKYS